VDAGVNGGLAHYVNMINGKYRETHPEVFADYMSSSAKSQTISHLKQAFRDHLANLEDLVHLHGLKCHHDMIPLHNHLQACFIKLEDNILAALNS